MSFEQNQSAGKGFEAAVAAQGVVRDEASCIVQESSGESGSTLKAHDYIGLSEVTSMPLKGDSSNKSLPDLNLGETELRLGPPKSLAAGSVKDGKNQAAAAEAPSKWHEKISIPSGIPEQQKGGADQKNEQDLQSNVFWQAQISAAAARMIQQQQQQQQQDVQAAQSPASDQMNNGYSNVIKNSNKRVFSEAIGSHGFVDGRSAMPTPPAASVAAANPSAPASNVKSAPLMPTSMYPWGSSSKQMPAAWRMGLEQSKGFGPFPSSRMHPQQRMNDSSAENNNNNNSNSPNSSGLTSTNKEDANEDVAPSTSPPVVGWPPVQSFRKNTLASHPPPPPKPSSATEINKSAAAAATTVAANPPATPASAANPPSPLFVKVYMDGVPIGRKVDLKTNNSYDKLSSVLEDMFHRFITGQNGASEASSSRDAAMSTEKKLNFLQSSDFVLTYEDKDGDLMLVGDVPWGMFTGTVKRLRIMKGSEAIGLAAAGDKAAAATLTCQA